jgi:hypothetical protein
VAPVSDHASGGAFNITGLQSASRGRFSNIWQPRICLATLITMGPTMLVFIFAQPKLVRDLLTGPTKELGTVSTVKRERRQVCHMQEYWSRSGHE